MTAVTTVRRLLAITDSDRLRDTLARLPAAWRIVVTATAQEATYRVGNEVSVVLVDLGEPERSVVAAKEVLEHTGEVPAVIVVDHDEASVGFPVVTRSATAVTLDRLLGRLADEGLAAIGTGGDAPQRVGAGTGGTVAEPQLVVEEPEPEPEPMVEESEPEPVLEKPEPELEPVVEESEPEPELVVEEPEPEPEPVVEETEPEPVVEEIEPEPESDPVVEEVEPEPEPVLEEPEPEPEPVVQQPEPMPVVEEVEPELEPVVEEPEPDLDPVVQEVEPEPQPVLEEPEPEPEPVVQQLEPEPVVEEREPEPEPAPESRPEPARVERPAAPSAGGALLKRLRDRMADGISRASDAVVSRDEDSQPVDAQVDRARAALEQVTGLIAEMPALGAFQTVAEALVAEVRDELVADTVAVWSEHDDELEVVAGHGLTPAESRMRVAQDQPVFADLTRNVHSVLLAPLDEARALVAGIAGARGDALMAASLEVDATPVAFVTVAAEHEFTPKDLARLEAIAKEAAPGLALARALTRLQHGDGAGAKDSELMATGDRRG